MSQEASPSDLRVLYVSHSSLVSGAEGALLDLLQALPRRVTPLLACPPGPLRVRAMVLGITLIDLPEAAGSLRLDSHQAATATHEILRAAIELRKQIHEHQPDLIHSNTLRAGLVVAAANMPRRAPTILHVHDVLPSSRAASAVQRVLLATTDTFLPVSKYVERCLPGTGRTTQSRSHVLYNPLDLNRFDPQSESREEARRKLGLAPGERVVALVAQITPWKGHDVAIRAISSVRKRHEKVRLILVGEPKFVGAAVRFDNPAYLRRLQALVDELGLGDYVEFWGERTDIPTIMRGVDVLVCPSWEEPFGRSVIEAMSSGTPAVATNNGGPAEYIDNERDGLLVPPHDVRGWVEAVSRLLEDDDERHAMGERASLKVRALFDREAYARSITDVYDDTIQRASRGRPRRSLRRKAWAAPNVQSDALRILFVEHSAELGGAQHSLLELVRSFHPRHDVVVATPAGPLSDAVTALGVCVASIPASQLTFRFAFPGSLVELSHASAARTAVDRLIAHWRPDIVHANTLRAGLISPRRRRGAPLVVHCRDLLPSGLVAETVRRLVMTRSSAVIAVSRTAAARLAGSEWTRRDVYVVDNPVDTRRFDPARMSRASARRALEVTGHPVLGLIAQITPWKGQDRAVRILARVRTRFPEATLVIAGEPKFVSKATSYDNVRYLREVESLIGALGLDGAVRFLGERQDVERVIASLDVLLVPSSEEPFGRTIVEAMAMDVPVLATNAGGPPDILRTGVDGETLPPADIDAWAEAVERIVGAHGRKGSRGYAIERFNPDRHASAVEAVYRGVLRARSV